MEESYLIYAVIGIAVLAIVSFIFKDRRMPPTSGFHCARCKSFETYKPRTIEAWRKGYAKIYCQSCHKKWLERQPKKVQENFSSSSSAGCAPVILALVIIPLGVVVFSHVGL